MNTKIVSAAAEFAKKKMSSYDAGHDWQHIERVRRLARHIQHTEKTGDPEVVELAAILHDIGDAKFSASGRDDSGEMAHDFFRRQGYDEENSSHIRSIIENISFRDRMSADPFNSVELFIVQDADRLDALGAIGIARTFNYGGFKNRELYDPEIPPREYKSADEYTKSDAPTLNHFYEKLFLLKDLMNTSTGKKLAAERHDFMVAFVERFKQEWHDI